MDSEGNPLEASITRNLRHPNIVQMLDYATRIRRVGRLCPCQEDFF